MHVDVPAAAEQARALVRRCVRLLHEGLAAAGDPPTGARVDRFVQLIQLNQHRRVSRSPWEKGGAGDYVDWARGEGREEHGTARLPPWLRRIRPGEEVTVSYGKGDQRNWQGAYGVRRRRERLLRRYQFACGCGRCAREARQQRRRERRRREPRDGGAEEVRRVPQAYSV
eukprot:gene19629-21253_t